MKYEQRYWTRLAAGFHLVALFGVNLQAQSTALPATYAFPASVADASKPGFIWNVSEVVNFEPNLLSWAEGQLAGMEGDNLADPTIVGVASGPAQAPNASTAPISFVIPGVINMAKTGGTSGGNFGNDGQMPGIPGTGGSTDNIAAELLTYLSLPAGAIAMGVHSDDGFRVTIGGTSPNDRFALNVGQFDGPPLGYDVVFQIVVPQAGLYATRLLYENGTGDASIEWFTLKDGLYGTNRVLINDVANGGIPAYRAITNTHAYGQKVDPAPSAVSVRPTEGIHIALVDGSTPVAQSSIALLLDGVALSPTISRTGNVTSVDYTPAPAWTSQSQHTASFIYTDGADTRTNTWSFTVQSYLSVDPNWVVTEVDTNKPGFIWNTFANSDSYNALDSNERAELDLTLQAVDATGAILPNLANPSSAGAATGPGVVLGASNAPIHFEIATTINLDPSTGTMPGATATDGSTDGQAAEVLTYLALPAGEFSMEVDSDNSFRLYAGPKPADVFGRFAIAERNNGNHAAGPVTFSFLVSKTGIYPFRLIWENGSGSSHLIWRSIDSTGNKVLVNDVAHGGIPAYRALLASSTVQPYLTGVTPVPVIHQMEVANTSLNLVIADGTHPVDDNSVTLTVDGKNITLVKNRQGSLLSVSDGGAAFPGLQLPSDVHSAMLSYKDSTGAYTRTQSWSFNNIQILVLPASPVKQENFDSYPEATSSANTAPPGWTAWNYTAENKPGWDLADKSSDSYKDWIIISTDTAGTIEGSALVNNPTQTINGKPIDNFASGNILWATSDGRTGIQAQFCTSAPFDLSTVTNPVLIYSSALRMSAEANVGSDGIEYSIDGGNTWQAGVVYVTISHNRNDYVYLQPDGTIDVNRTLNAPFSFLVWSDQNGKVGGGSMGSGLAEPVTQALAPLIALRSDRGNLTTKVDGIRLPGASKQKDVRLRFFQLGNCSYWWGIDNLAFYDIAPPVAPVSSPPQIDSVHAAAGQITVKWSSGGTLESTPTLTSPTWTTTGNSSGLFSEPITSTGNNFYRVRQ